MKMNLVKLVLFDLDDTLFDHRYSNHFALKALQREYPHLGRKPFPLLCKEYQRLLDELHPRVLTGEMTKEESRNERFHRINLWCGDTPPELDGKSVAARFREVYQSSRQTLPGALALLQALKPRVQIGIVTNNITRVQKEKLLHCALHDWVDFMVTSEEVGFPKPDPKIFLTALERAGVEPAEAVMVGDSWEADVIGAREAGIRAVWLNREGLPCPDPGLAERLEDLEATDEIVEMLLNTTHACQVI